MRTTLNIDEKLLESIVELTGEKSISKAVSTALKEYSRGVLIKRLLSRQGKVDLDLDDWYEFRHMDR